jgi:hypothetical protein
MAATDIDVSNRGKRWSAADSERLKTLYSRDEWDLVKLAYEFKRTPCSIWSRLVQYNLISDPEEARGYDLYLDQYADRYAALPPRPPKEPITLKTDILVLQKELGEIKTLVQQILVRLEQAD